MEADSLTPEDFSFDPPPAVQIEKIGVCLTLDFILFGKTYGSAKQQLQPLFGPIRSGGEDRRLF